MIFSIKVNPAYAREISWSEVSKTEAGIQYLDKETILNKGGGIIEIKTKYLKKNLDNYKIIEEYIYTMQINCLNSQYKDISVNGKKLLNVNWQGPNGDKLIDDVISESCKMLKASKLKNHD